MPPGLATTCAGDATWRCLIGGFRGILDHARWGGYKDLRLSGGFRMDPRPFALGRAAVFRLNVPAILLLTTRAGVNIWRCLIGGFRGILDHARWAGHLDVLDRRISGHSRLCVLGWKRLWRRLGCLHRDGVQPCTPWLRVPLRVRSVYIPCCRTKAAKRLPFYISHHELALLPTCKGSRGGQASEVAPSEAQGGGRGITRMAEHRGRNRRRHFRLLEACCACCSRWRL